MIDPNETEVTDIKITATKEKNQRIWEDSKMNVRYTDAIIGGYINIKPSTKITTPTWRVFIVIETKVQ